MTGQTCGMARMIIVVVTWRWLADDWQTKPLIGPWPAVRTIRRDAASSLWKNLKMLSVSYWRDDRRLYNWYWDRMVVTWSDGFCHVIQLILSRDRRHVRSLCVRSEMIGIISEIRRIMVKITPRQICLGLDRRNLGTGRVEKLFTVSLSLCLSVSLSLCLSVSLSLSAYEKSVPAVQRPEMTECSASPTIFAASLKKVTLC